MMAKLLHHPPGQSGGQNSPNPGEADGTVSALCCVVIVNWRRPELTLSCVESLLRSTCTEFRVIVCDNGSGDNSVSRFLHWAQQQPPGVAARTASVAESTPADTEPGTRVNWIVSTRNLGFAGGANLGLAWGLRQGGCSHFWLLNNDSIVDADALGALLLHMRQRPRVGICGARIVYLGDRQRIQAYGGARFNRWTGRGFHLGHGADVDLAHDAGQVVRRMSYVSGASMFVSRRFVETVGLLEEGYFLFFEELDWVRRAAGRFDLGYAPDAIVWHHEGATIGSSSEPGRSSELSDFFMCRSLLRFTLRFHPVALPSVWLVAFLRSLHLGLSGRRRRMLTQWQALFGLVRCAPDVWVSRHLAALGPSDASDGRR
ncbi:MAG: glycosyltransferase family 2 protein [Rubrivivax sp.]|nr:glycosyltransferase family 2 protein [Rubrivivax sp.]